VSQTLRASQPLTVGDTGPVAIDRTREARRNGRVESRDLGLHRRATLRAHLLQELLERATALVTVCSTNATIAALAVPSFQLGSISLPFMTRPRFPWGFRPAPCGSPRWFDATTAAIDASSTKEAEIPRRPVGSGNQPLRPMPPREPSITLA
jgi:hypothetical protein